MKISVLSCSLVLGLAAVPGAALAQDTAPPADATPAKDSAAPEHEDPISVDLTLSGVTDYRFRGLSLSDRDPAFQPSITVTHTATGIYLSAWGSNIASNGGADIEIDLTAGINREIKGFNAGALVVYYLYPGAGGDNYVELQGTVSHKVGPATIGGLVAWAPKQSNIGNVSNIYGQINGSVPLGKSPLTLIGSFGIEDGAFDIDNKKDWSIGLGASVKGFNLNLAYVDTAHTGGDPNGSATVVFTLARTF